MRTFVSSNLCFVFLRFQGSAFWGVPVRIYHIFSSWMAIWVTCHATDYEGRHAMY